MFETWNAFCLQAEAMETMCRLLISMVLQKENLIPYHIQWLHRALLQQHPWQNWCCLQGKCLLNKLENPYWYMQNHYTSISLPVKVAQLVSANTGKCGPSKWHMVLNLNPATDDTLNLPGVGCCGLVSTLRFGSPWRVLRAWSWKVHWL